MGESTEISWADATFNPWIGCSRVSPGCEHCYAEQFASVRMRLPVWGVDGERKPMSEAYWRQPAKWNRKAAKEGRPVRVFCASMADVFDVALQRNVSANAVMNSARDRFWRVIESTPSLTWLLLTKRPQNIDRIAPWGRGNPWPDNVWLGVTAEDQRRADERIPILLEVPAKVRFVSHEPALQDVDFWAFLRGRFRDESLAAIGSPPMPGLDWIITGGESGPGARPYAVEWARSVIRQCRAAGIAPFVKQLGASARLADRKGADMSEWPEDLRVREFPRLERDRGKAIRFEAI